MENCLSFAPRRLRATPAALLAATALLGACPLPAPAEPAAAAVPTAAVVGGPRGESFVLQAGHPSLQVWRLPAVPAPADNALTPARITLGEKLFFDERLSITGQTSCASCHLPARGWGDGLPLSMRFMGERMTRNSPSIVNVGFNRVLMWDGRNATLEQQVLSSISASGSLNAGAKELGHSDAETGLERIRINAGYRALFAAAYPGEPIERRTVARAIATFERSLVSDGTPFDRWVKGDAAALTAQQVEGLRVFIDPARGNCMACHAPPAFTDHRFHNIGLRQFGESGHDVGRFKEQPLPELRGAFRTPPLREVVHTPPYFHDGSARTLRDVIVHYLRGGEVRDNLSPLLRPAPLNADEQAALLSFMQAISSPAQVYDAPRLPR